MFPGFNKTKIGIRDDDTNFYTHPDELIFAYGEVWNECPVTLAVIPFIKGNWNYWVHEIEKNNGAIDWEIWRKDNQIWSNHWICVCSNIPGRMDRGIKNDHA